MRQNNVRLCMVATDRSYLVSGVREVGGQVMEGGPVSTRSVITSLVSPL